MKGVVDREMASVVSLMEFIKVILGYFLKGERKPACRFGDVPKDVSKFFPPVFLVEGMPLEEILFDDVRTFFPSSLISS